MPNASRAGIQARQATAPDATVVLLTQDPGTTELETLRRLKAQRYPGRMNILVIDSSRRPMLPSNQVLRAAADQWEAIPPDSFRHAGTRQRALEACTTPVVAYLSADAQPATDGWLAALLAPILEGTAEASYGRQQSPVADSEREATFRFLYPSRPEIKTKASIPELGLRTFHFSDVTSAFDTSIARSVGFPTDLPTFEDVGVAKRLLDAGHRIAYVPEAVVLHAHQLTPREILSRYRRIGAIYEQLGIFSDLRRAGRSPFSEGLRVTRAVAPQSKRSWSPQPLFVGGMKAAAVTCGRLEQRFSAGRRRASSSA